MSRFDCVGRVVPSDAIDPAHREQATRAVDRQCCAFRSLNDKFRHVGFGMKSIIFTTTLFAFWIIILNARAGVLQIKRSLIEMARCYGANPFQVFYKIYF
ncbi:ABC transporter permease subunit [Labrenzia sp. DG1229]|uniref:ABC transporter permease subunit n=1 Tax=Labrenzia sp. DG1229 TaxID=681847 RepID=UPI0025710A2A|nr:ABC transporter permease subunit [Labrenzia sp. DG1229]